MLKININVFNCKNENATTRPMISQNFKTFQKMRISEKISKKYRNFEFYKRERSEVYRMERHSTSPPCGNLVDGLPHDCHLLVLFFSCLVFSVCVCVSFAISFVSSLDEWQSYGKPPTKFPHGGLVECLFVQT